MMIFDVEAQRKYQKARRREEKMFGWLLIVLILGFGLQGLGLIP